LHEAIDWNKIISVASLTNGRPFYGTIWFSLVATIAVVLVFWVVAISSPNLEGRPVRGEGQFGVVLVAAYWVFVFPRLRKSRTGENKPEPDPSQRGKVVK
jgi:hypothetical protein